MALTKVTDVELFTSPEDNYQGGVGGVPINNKTSRQDYGMFWLE